MVKPSEIPQIEIIQGKYMAPFSLIGASPGMCQECAVDHPPELPHNQQSLFYQYHFYNEHGRWPTWKDAMAHCTEEVRNFWLEELQKRGVKID